MKRKLAILNLALLAAIAWAGLKIRREYLDGKVRERAVLGKRVKPVPPPPVAKLPAPQPVTAAGYVVIEDAPPPAKPMPALPVVHGIMQFPDGPTVMMAPKSGAADRGYRIGEVIGEFMLKAVDERDITFEWDGQLVTRRIEEVIERKVEAAPASAPAAAASAASQAQRTPAPAGQPAPGVSIVGGIKACQPGDTSPAGTITDGMRKVVSPSPFGEVCRWEPVR